MIAVETTEFEKYSYDYDVHLEEKSKISLHSFQRIRYVFKSIRNEFLVKSPPEFQELSIRL